MVKIHNFTDIEDLSCNFFPFYVDFKNFDDKSIIVNIFNNFENIDNKNIVANYSFIKNNPKFSNIIGLYHIHVTKKYTLAIRYLEFAISKNIYEATLNLAIFYFKQNNYDLAKKYLKTNSLNNDYDDIVLNYQNIIIHNN